MAQQTVAEKSFSAKPHGKATLPAQSPAASGITREALISRELDVVMGQEVQHG